MSRIRERISTLVNQQLPEFIRADNTTFVSFIEAYYKFLEQDQHAQEVIQNATSYTDIDRTTSEFVSYFLKNYASLIPANILANKPLLIKRINDLYSAKGSELSFKLLFRILYNADVSIKHPYDFVLKPSDGIWEQQVSIRVRQTGGSIAGITDRVLSLIKNDIRYNTPIIRVKTLIPGLFEVFIRTSNLPPLDIGDTVYVFDNTNALFVGTIEPTPINYQITSPGTGFKVGQIFNVSISGAVNTIVQISKVNSVGGIERLKIINFGYNFTSDPITIELYNTLELASRTIDVGSKIAGFSEYFEIVRHQTLLDPNRYFLSDYVVEGYMGDMVRSQTISALGINSTTVNTTSTDPDIARMTFTMGAIGRYPGRYITNQGFPSEPDIRLQDDKLYQPFAYQLETEADIISFYDIVKQLIHPSGTNMFNNRLISTSINVNENINLDSQTDNSINVEDSSAIVDVMTISVL